MSERRTGRAVLTAHELPPEIQWHEGMLLAPQHFQWQGLRQDALLHYHAATLSPFYWGVRHLEIDPVSLVDGTLRVLALEAVMPDGLVVSVLPGEVPGLTLDLRSHLDEIRAAPLTVHLAVVARGRGLSLAERYASEEREGVPDQNTGDGEIAVPVLTPRLTLLLGDEPPPRYVSFPLLEVTFRNEAFARTPFEPPWLRVTGSSALGELGRSIATRVREKAAFLADQLHAPSSAGGAQLLETRLTLHALVAALPTFEEILRSGSAHPFPLFLALCNLVGHLAAVGHAAVPPVLPPYHHNDLQATFEQARSAIFRILDEGIQESYSGYQLAWREGAFGIRFDPAWLGRALVLGVRTGAGSSAKETDEWVASSLIGAHSTIASLRDRRVVGVVRRRLDGDGELVASRDVTLYALAADGELLIPDEVLEVRNPGESRHRPAEITLYVRVEG